MATITKATLRNRVLSNIGVLAAGETANAEDALLVEEKIDSVHAILLGKKLLQWDTNAIPDYAILPMIAMVSSWTRPAFEMPGPSGEWTIGEQGLRRQVSRTLNGEPVQAVYF